MQSKWSQSKADAYISRYAQLNVSKDMALRVYTTQLLGRDPLLVLHGGGNTSVKTKTKDLFGNKIDVLGVKGSGWDMGDIEPAGLPLVRLEPLQQLRTLEHLSDEDMVNVQRSNLMDSTAPNPSVETLLHAFLPHKFIDHTHSTDVLSIIDQPNGEELAREIWQDRMGYVPYIKPGFDLAKTAAEVFEQNTSVEGLILLKHGIFTFGETAKEAYERMINMVTLAEEHLQTGKRPVFAAADLPSQLATVGEISPILRGVIALHKSSDEDPDRFVLNHRCNEQILRFVNGAELSDYSQRGVVTPDHIIRTKNKPLIVPAPESNKMEEFAEAVKGSVKAYQAAYDAYFERENLALGGGLTKLDPMPRVILVPGIGLYGVGKTASAASAAADLAENSMRVISDAEAIGTYQPLSETELFELEYWSLEQAKLAKAKDLPLTRQIAVVTGGAGTIGKATAKALKAEGAAVVLLDFDPDKVQQAAKEIGALGIECDVTDKDSIRKAFNTICETYGGVDIVISNAGAAWQGRIGEVSDDILRQSFELNFFAHQNIAQAAIKIMQAQNTGGCLLFNVSKQAVNPGPNFGPYGLPKAATMSLVRQYAVDYGSEGIRSNGVNADRIRSGLLTNDFIGERATARGVSEKTYMSGNLLQREVLAEDVAKSFVNLAKAHKTTGHIDVIDGGNIAAALR